MTEQLPAVGRAGRQRAHGRRSRQGRRRRRGHEARRRPGPRRFPGQLVTSGAQIVVDLTVPESTEANVRFAVEHGMHAVVGTTGWDADRLAALEEPCSPSTRRRAS